MKSRFHYIRPESADHAVEILSEHLGSAAILAGGTDLGIKIRSGKLKSQYVVDVSRIEELRGISLGPKFLSIGAGVTYSEIIRNPLVVENAPVLVSAARYVGSLQIRNMGTLGGNVGNASPAADSIPALMAHSAWVKIRNSLGERLEPLGEVVAAPYKTSLKPGDLIMEFLLEPMPDYAFSFQRIARRKSLSIARINAACLGTTTKDSVITDIRVSVGSVTPEPCRMTAAEQVLVGNAPSPELFHAAARAVSEEMMHRSGIRSSTGYKKPAVEGLVFKALREMFTTTF